MNAEIGSLRKQEVLDQLMKLDELVQHADPRSIEWLIIHTPDDLHDPLTLNKVRALIAFFEAEPTHLAREADNQGTST